MILTMNFDQAIDEVAAKYAARGYAVVARPKPDDLPPFAKQFKIQVVARLHDIGVLVAIKRNRSEFAADPEMDRYAEVTSSQPGWRFDFVLLEGSNMNQETEGAQELSAEQLQSQLQNIEYMLHADLRSAAFVAAWGIMEAATRRLLQSSGQVAGWGTSSRQMINELVSNGMISMEEHARLYVFSRLRNEIVHGFDSRFVDVAEVHFLTDLAKRLMVEASLPKAQTE